MSKEQMLADYVERWFKQGPRRSIQMLSRMTNVPYPTIRRMAQKESSPSLETAMAVLNVVATVPETLAYFADNEGVNRFFKRLSEYSLASDHDFKAEMIDRESFWVLMLGLTIGAHRVQVKDLLGSFGLATLDRLVTRGVMIEKSPDVFIPSGIDPFVYIESARLAHDAIGYIAEIPCEEAPFQRFLVCNVTESAFVTMRDILKKAFDECQRVAADNEGDHVAGFTFLAKSLTLKQPG